MPRAATENQFTGFQVTRRAQIAVPIWTGRRPRPAAVDLAYTGAAVAAELSLPADEGDTTTLTEPHLPGGGSVRWPWKIAAARRERPNL